MKSDLQTESLQEASVFNVLVDSRQYRDAIRLYNGLPSNLQEELRQDPEVNWRYRIAVKAARLPGV